MVNALLAALLLLSPRETALRFCRALNANAIRSFTPLIGDQQNPPTRLLRRLRYVTENFDCVTVSSYRWKVENDEIVIDVDAEGITRNSKHERRRIPSRWFLRIDGDRVVAFDDDVSRLEAGLMAARDDAQRELLVVQNSDDVVASAAWLLSEDVPLGDAAAMRPAAEFLVNWSRDSGKHEIESYALSALGNVERALKNRDAAQHLFEAARDAARQSASCDAVAYADYQASAIAPKPKRMELLNAIADSIESLDNPRPGILALRDLMAIYSVEYAFGQLYAVIDRTAAISRRYGNAEGMARAIFYRGRAAVVVFDGANAVPLLRQARAIADETMMSRLSAQTSIGFYFCHDYRKEKDQALQSLRDALNVLQPEDTDLIAYTQAEISRYLTHRFHETREAEAHYETALRMAQDAGSYRQNVLAVGAYLRYAQGRYPEAFSQAREAIAVDPESLDWVWSLKILSGRILFECGSVGDAIEEFRSAIDYIEARRANSTSSAIVRAGYADERSSSYRDLIAALIAQGDFEEAFGVMEQFKARSLAEALPADTRSLPLTPAEQQQKRELNQRIVALNRAVMTSSSDRELEARRQLFAARADLERFTLETFMRHSPNALPVHDEARDPSRQWHGTTVLEYVVVLDSVAAFVVRDGKVWARVLAMGNEELKERTTRFLDRIEKRDLDYAKEGRALYDALIAPVNDLLPKEGILNVVPDDFLWKLPFDALVTPSHHFLAERFAIAYAPSLLMLARATRHPQATHASHELLALGDPLIAQSTSRKAAEYRGLSLGAIPDALHEVRALADVYGKSNSTVLTGTAARESVVKNVIGQYRIIHLATHGIVDDTSPLYSAIVLASAKGDPDDGLLEMREMSNLDLHADLVVLSGCDTARGNVLSGEGVIGMSWALFSAGCPTTVVSQWKAMSRPTTQLMIAFHKHLHAGEPKAVALRHARLELMKTPAYHHPFYWAPFVMVGEGEGRVK